MWGCGGRESIYCRTVRFIVATLIEHLHVPSRNLNSRRLAIPRSGVILDCMVLVDFYKSVRYFLPFDRSFFLDDHFEVRAGPPQTEE